MKHRTRQLHRIHNFNAYFGYDSIIGNIVASLWTPEALIDLSTALCHRI
jgi:hypothetical protein